MWRVALVALIACGSQPRAVKREPTTTIVEVGAEPRQVLRYVLAPGTTERMELTVKQRTLTSFTNTVLENGRESIDAPTIKTVMRVEVASVDADGGARVTSTVESVTVLDDVVDPAVRTRVVAEMAPLEGARVTWRLAPSGRSFDVIVDASAKRLAHISNSVSETVFPDVAIGVGARWQVTSPVSLGGVIWNRAVTYHLRALTETSATIDAQLVMGATEQALAVEPNATTKVTSGTAKANVTMIVPLRGLVATGSTEGTSELNFVIVRDRLRITSTVQTETLSSVRPAP